MPLRAGPRIVRRGLTLRTITFSLAVLGDVLFRIPLVRLAEAQARHRADTRMYLFGWAPPVMGGRLGSPHAVELPFVFGNLDANGASELIGNNPEQDAERQALSGAIQGAWVAFARSGNPEHAGLPSWPVYEPLNRHTLVFDSASIVVSDPFTEDRLFWGEVPFDGVIPALDSYPL
jgi:para-nitrobenzyl esterase